MNKRQRSIGRTHGLKLRLSTLAVGGIALTLAWTLGGTSATQSSPAGHQEPPNASEPSSATSASLILVAGGASSMAELLPGPGPAGSASTIPVAQQQRHPSSPEVDLGTQARLALQSGTADEAEKAAFAVTFCESIDSQLHNLDSAPLKDSSVKRSVMNLLMGEQRRCQALDAAAKALYEPLMLKAVEGGSRSAARSISTRSELLAKLTPEQRLRVAQTVKEEAARGDWISIFILSNASARLGTSLQDDYAYSIALQSIRQVEGKNMSYFKLQSREQIELWDAQLEFKAQQLSPAEVEQSRQQAEAVLRSYREARLKNQNHDPKQP